jgi:hypothetical protein
MGDVVNLVYELRDIIYYETSSDVRRREELMVGRRPTFAVEENPKTVLRGVFA